MNEFIFVGNGYDDRALELNQNARNQDNDQQPAARVHSHLMNFGYSVLTDSLERHKKFTLKSNSKKSRLSSLLDSEIIP